MVTDFAALEGIEPNQTAHLALVVMAVAVARPKVLKHQFPEMLFSPSIANVTGSASRLATSVDEPEDSQLLPAKRDVGR